MGVCPLPWNTFLGVCLPEIFLTLRSCIWENHHSVVSHGADINAEDIYGNTALIFASRNAVFLDGDNFSETRRKRRTINPRRRTSQGRPMMVEKCIERLKNIKSVESNRQINSCINVWMVTLPQDIASKYDLFWCRKMTFMLHAPFTKLMLLTRVAPPIDKMTKLQHKSENENRIALIWKSVDSWFLFWDYFLKVFQKMISKKKSKISWIELNLWFHIFRNFL